MLGNIQLFYDFYVMKIEKNFTTHISVVYHVHIWFDVQNIIYPYCE